MGSRFHASRCGLRVCCLPETWVLVIALGCGSGVYESICL